MLVNVFVQHSLYEVLSHKTRLTRQSHSRSFETTLLLSRVCVPVSITLKLCLYIVPFLRHSASKMAWPWDRGRGRSRSLKMAPFDRSYTTFYWSAIVSIALCSRRPCSDFMDMLRRLISCRIIIIIMLYHFRVIWCWIIVTLKYGL